MDFLFLGVQVRAMAFLHRARYKAGCTMLHYRATGRVK